MFRESQNILKKTLVGSVFVVNPFGQKRKENHKK